MGAEQKKTPTEILQSLKKRFGENKDRDAVPPVRVGQLHILTQVRELVNADENTEEPDQPLLDTQPVVDFFKKLDEKFMAGFKGNETDSESRHVQAVPLGESNGLYIVRQQEEGLVKINVIQIRSVGKEGIQVRPPANQYTIKSNGEFIHSVLVRGENGKVTNPTIASNKPEEPQFAEHAPTSFQRFQREIAPFMNR